MAIEYKGVERSYNKMNAHFTHVIPYMEKRKKIKTQVKENSEIVKKPPESAKKCT